MFILIHSLTNRGAGNVNRDNNNRPKTAIIGETLRNITSSQNDKYNIKRLLEKTFNMEASTQTPMLPRYFYQKLIDGGINEDLAIQYAMKILEAFVDLKKKNKEEKEESDPKKKKKEKDPLKTETIKFQPSEMKHLEDLINKIINGYTPSDKDFHYFKPNTAVDIALTGRMIASRPEYQVHAAFSSNFGFTVNEIKSTQQDYFTAIDTLKMEGHSGSGHLDFFHFSQGVYYNFRVINLNLLIKNLNDNRELAIKTVKQILEVIAKFNPEANWGRCADGLSWPSYIMVEKTETTPRSLCRAFSEPIKGPDIMSNAIKALETLKSNFDGCYGPIDSYVLNVDMKKGTLKELLNFIN